MADWPKRWCCQSTGRRLLFPHALLSLKMVRSYFDTTNLAPLCLSHTDYARTSLARVIFVWACLGARPVALSRGLQILLVLAKSVRVCSRARCRSSSFRLKGRESSLLRMACVRATTAPLSEREPGTDSCRCEHAGGRHNGEGGGFC